MSSLPTVTEHQWTPPSLTSSWLRGAALTPANYGGAFVSAIKTRRAGDAGKSALRPSIFVPITGAANILLLSDGSPIMASPEQSRYNRFIELAQWGTQAAFDEHAAALTKIFASVKLVGK